jgi:GNAT superfamily N-acetyltransferase
MIALRVCETDSDYEAWLAVRRAVLPDERTSTLDELYTFIEPGDLHLLALVDGELAGNGLCNRSDTGGAHTAPRVLPSMRGRGVGSALLVRLAEHAVERGFARAGAHVQGGDEPSVAFARKFGFTERRRDVQQVRVLDDGCVPKPRDVEGIEVVSLADRPQLLREAYPLAQQGWEDIPIDDIDISLHSWLIEGAGSLPEGSLVALAAGEIVGFAGLMRWHGEPAKAEHGLTVVRRDWRGRGVAAALKERQAAWAVANGIRELVTWTQTGNENMQAVNERLGYRLGSFSIAFGRELPL